jgi:hypothetical protein
LGREVFSVTKHMPVFAGVNATDPFQFGYADGFDGTTGKYRNLIWARVMMVGRLTHNLSS